MEEIPYTVFPTEILNLPNCITFVLIKIYSILLK